MVPIEVERKFLLRGSPPEGGELFEQVYLPGPVVKVGALILRESGVQEARVRVRGNNDATLDFKGVPSTARGAALQRKELTFRLPQWVARGILRLPFRRRIRKRRIFFGPWEIDVFLGHLSGLIMGEIEDPAFEGSPTDPLPDGLAVVRDVSREPAFHNRMLANPSTSPSALS